MVLLVRTQKSRRWWFRRLGSSLMKEKIELSSSSSAAAAAAAAGLIFMEIRLVCLTSFKYFIILYMFVEWVILLHDLYSLMVRPVCQFILTTRTTTCAACPTAATLAHNAEERGHVENDDKASLGVDPKIVMERLGMFWDRDDKRQIVGLEEILDLFDEDEPSLEEVKEAFGVFDRNKDGYIDAKELQDALSKMGYLRISESDCRLMIDGYDVDEDSKISFREFLKLMEDCFR